MTSLRTDRIWIDRTPGDGPISVTRLKRNACDARAVYALLGASPGEHIGRNLYYNAEGTWITTPEQPPLLAQMGVTSNAPGLIEMILELDELLAMEVGSITRFNHEQRPPCTEHDRRVLDRLRSTAHELAGAQKRELLIEDDHGRGGTLHIPARSELLPTQPSAPGDEVVRGITPVKQITTTTGMEILVPSDAFDRQTYIPGLIYQVDSAHSRIEPYMYDIQAKKP